MSDKPDNRPAWMRNQEAFDAIAEQTFPEAPVALTTPSVPVAPAVTLTTLSASANAGGQQISLDDNAKRYTVSCTLGEGRVVTGSVKVGASSAPAMTVRMPKALVARLDRQILGARSTGITALLMHALHRLTEQQLTLTYSEGRVSTGPGKGRIESGVDTVGGEGVSKVSTQLPGALVKLIDERRDGPWPATLVALLTYALDDLATEGHELRLRVSKN